MAISANNEEEVVEAAAQHAVKVHGHEDGLELRAMLRQGVKSGMPAA